MSTEKQAITATVREHYGAIAENVPRWQTGDRLVARWVVFAPPSAASDLPT